MDYGTPCAKFSQRPPSSYHALNSVNFLHKQNFCSSHNQDSDKSFERTKAFRCKDGIWRRGGGEGRKITVTGLHIVEKVDIYSSTMLRRTIEEVRM